MPTENVERKLVAILSADVKGYSRLMGEDEVGTLRRLTAYREVTDALIQQHRGRIVGTAGDSILAEFASAVDAVQCAVDIQQALKTKNADLPSARRMEFRIGINVGDVIVEGSQIYGDGVNIAARLEALAEGGGICISGTVYDQTENKLALGYEYLGEQTVKNIAKPVRVYRVVLEESSSRQVTSQQERNASIAQRGVTSGKEVPFPPLPDKPSIAVLPFVNMSSDPEQEYFSDGITEDLITDLSKLSGLFVIARNSVFTYKGTAVKVEQVGRELGVQYVLEGSVRKVGGRVRITGQLVEALTGHPLWADRYDGELQDIFALQDAVTQKIVTALKIQLTQQEHGRMTRPPTTNLEAYDSYLRGSEYYWHLTKETNIQARQMFEKAVELDPAYATAYAYLSGTYLREWSRYWNQDPQTLERAFEFAQKAATLDSSLPVAHTFLGWAYMYKEQHEQAIAAGAQAITLDPNYAGGYAWLGHFLCFAGRPEEAVALIQQAMRLDPNYPAIYLFFLGLAYQLTRQYEEAIDALQRSLIVNPSMGVSHLTLAIIYSELDREEEARTEMSEALRISPDYSLKADEQIWRFYEPAQLERRLTSLRKVGLK
ncbi:MAG: adenylate/guanylate cyclase domain-containing protein [Deltaproteobacteria bacterium]|nr:adenylate/guanylate cyclase domain-containing protein [Deltaproteobacteria bacterium]